MRETIDRVLRAGRSRDSIARALASAARILHTAVFWRQNTCRRAFTQTVVGPRRRTRRTAHYITMATEGDYFERYQQWKAAKEAEMAARSRKPLAVANTNVTAVQTPARTAPAAKPMLVEKPVAPPQTPKAVPAITLPAPPSVRRTPLPRSADRSSHNLGHADADAGADAGAAGGEPRGAAEGVA